MNETSVPIATGTWVLLWLTAGVIALLLLTVLFFYLKGRKVAGAHVFRASRFSRGNFLFPTQVGITPTSVVQYTPEWTGRVEHTIHMAHISSVLVETNLLFSNVLIETSGGTSPVRCHGHRKGDAVEMKTLIEQYQTDYYRAQGPPPGTPRT